MGSGRRWRAQRRGPEGTRFCGEGIVAGGRLVECVATGYRAGSWRVTRRADAAGHIDKNTAQGVMKLLK